jgi:hypothetical protein
MKIFAKRKRKSSLTTTTNVRNSFASDPVVEKLLKLDPSQWNARQKRMVKRYQDRKDEQVEVTSGDVPSENSKLEEAAADGATPASQSITNDDEEDDKEESGGNDSDSGTENSSDGEGEGEGENDGDVDDGDVDGDGDGDGVEIQQETEDNTEDKTVEATTFAATPMSLKGDEPTDVDSQDPKDGDEAAVMELLEGLNSKWKRTLTRKLQRGGKAVFEEVAKEAKEILATTTETSSSSDTKKKRKHEETTNATGAKSSSSESPAKKSKKGVDLSKLPAEERLRREDQRRKQKEAEERRAQGEDAKTKGLPHKHPLNSERRRANRRKPKWNKKSTSSTPPNEHDTSGYQHRRTTGQAVVASS